MKNHKEELKKKKYFLGRLAKMLDPPFTLVLIYQGIFLEADFVN